MLRIAKIHVFKYAIYLFKVRLVESAHEINDIVVYYVTKVDFKMSRFVKIRGQFRSESWEEVHNVVLKYVYGLKVSFG